MALAAIYSLFIINKSGGLIYYKDYGSAGRTDTNDSLRLASLWHSMHAISQQLSPTPGCEGIDLLQAHNFDLHCFQSLTGLLSSSSVVNLRENLTWMLITAKFLVLLGWKSIITVCRFFYKYASYL
jgi:hypothetical protein